MGAKKSGGCFRSLFDLEVAWVAFHSLPSPSPAYLTSESAHYSLLSVGETLAWEPVRHALPDLKRDQKAGLGGHRVHEYECQDPDSSIVGSRIFSRHLFASGRYYIAQSLSRGRVWLYKSAASPLPYVTRAKCGCTKLPHRDRDVSPPPPPFGGFSGADWF